MSASSAAVIAAMTAQRKKLVSYFVSVGAVSPERAVPSDSLPSVQFRMLERLREDKVICTTSLGNLYLDQARAAELQTRRQSTAIKVVIVVVLLAVATIAAGLVLSARS